MTFRVPARGWRTPRNACFAESLINQEVRSPAQDTTNDKKLTLRVPARGWRTPAQNIRGCLKRNACFEELEGPGRPSMAQEAPGHSTAQHSTAQHSTVQHSTAQHSLARPLTHPLARSVTRPVAWDRPWASQGGRL